MPDVIGLMALTAALILVAATPGPGVLLTLSRSLESGFRAGVLVALGITLIDLLVLSITLSGLNLLVEYSETAWRILRWFGAAFLIWLAWQNAFHPTPHSTDLPNATRHDLTSGMAIGLSHPVLFYLAFLPAFIDLNSLSSFSMLGLIAWISGIVFGVLLLIAGLANWIRSHWLVKHPQTLPKLHRLSALLFFFIALLLIYQNLV